jgi:hypothetical protein
MSQTQVATQMDVQSPAATLVLDIKGGNLTLGTQVIVWSQNVPTSPNQVWVFTSDGHIRCKQNPNLVLDIYNGKLDPGMQVIVWTENFPASPNQLWFLTGDGHIASQGNPNLVLDITGGDLTPGTPVIVFSQNYPASPNQLWGFTSDGHIQQSTPHSLTVANNAGYAADCSVTYIINGVQQNPRSTITLGQSFSVNIPTGAHTIHLVCSGTGLNATIIDRTYTDVAAMGTQRVFRLTGTLFNPTYGEDGGSSSNQPAAQVVVHHNGWYIARCYVTYYMGSQQQSQSSGDFTRGNTYTAQLPVGATSIETKCESDTGLFWSPSKTIFDLTYSAPTQLNFTIGGTSLNPNYSQE